MALGCSVFFVGTWYFEKTTGQSPKKQANVRNNKSRDENFIKQTNRDERKGQKSEKKPRSTQESDFKWHSLFRAIDDMFGGLTVIRAVMSGKLKFKNVNGADFEFIYIPPGKFMMGCGEEEGNRLVAETQNVFFGHNAKPLFVVDLQEGFFILKNEVTKSQFAALMGKQEHKDSQKSRKHSDDLPVQEISWIEAMKFCQKLGEISGFAVRPPTEIEWEYSARGPWEQRYPWAEAKEFHAHAGNDSCEGPVRISAKCLDVSWRGVYNMSGNVSEWCLDVYDGEKYQKVKEKPMVYFSSKVAFARLKLDLDKSRTYRGGAYNDPKHNCCVFIRRWERPDVQSTRIGFRPVIVLQSLSNSGS